MADISKIKLPNNSTYNIKDDSAITSISKNHNNITITYRDGTTSTINDPYYDSIYATEIQGGDLIVTGSARFLNTINGSISGNAATATSATKATQDGNGAVISTTYLKVAQKGVANGLAELDANGIIVSSQLPSFVDDVIEGYYYNNKFYKESTHTTQITGETGKIYVNLESGTDQNKTYRWSGSAFVVISETLALGETSSTAYRGDRGKTAYDHATDSSRLTTATASGLYKVASTAQGHIASLTAVTKADITGLGIPGSDTDRYVNSAAFADATSADANNPVKMTLTRAGSDTASVTAYIPKVSSSSAGVVPKGTTVSSQSQSTKFLREDGTWAVPSYTTDTNTTYTIGTSGNTVTLTPSSGSVQSITVPYATSAGSATDNTKLPLAGGTMTGDILFANSGTNIRQIKGTNGDSDAWRIAAGATGSNAGWLEIATADDYNEPIYVRQYRFADASTPFGSVQHEVVLLDENGNSSFSGKITSGLYEGFLNWGGRSLSASVTPIGMSLSMSHNANRLAFINGDLITSEFSADNGSTWTAHNLTASQKSWFFTDSVAINVGKQQGSTEACTLDSKTRITITAQDGTNPSDRVYISPKKMLINVSTANGLSVLVEYRTGTNYLNDGAWSTFGTYTVSGWSGWNDIPLVISSLGGDKTQTGNIWQLRLTFSVTSLSTNESYRGSCSVTSVRIFSDNSWASPSTIASTNHLYRYDVDKNAYFPNGVLPNVTNSYNLGHPTYKWATVYATTFNGTATNLSGFTNTTTTATAINDATQNGHVFVNGTSDIYGISDGAAFVQAYSTSWVAQIYQDYRTGQIALRGKNNGTWQAWRKVWDSVNLTSKTAAASGTDLSLVTTGEKAVWNAKPSTDTKNTAGSTDTSSKIYLIGATSQAANPQTYSDDQVYVTSGVLTTKSVQVGGGSATMEYSATTKSINFVFAS